MIDVEVNQRSISQWVSFFYHKNYVWYVNVTFGLILKKKSVIVS